MLLWLCALLKSGATIAVVARYANGSIFQYWTKRLTTSDPCIAEASALLWAMEITRAVHVLDIVVEGDAKICIHAFHGTTDCIP